MASRLPSETDDGTTRSSDGEEAEEEEEEEEEEEARTMTAPAPAPAPARRRGTPRSGATAVDGDAQAVVMTL